MEKDGIPTKDSILNIELFVFGQVKLVFYVACHKCAYCGHRSYSAVDNVVYRVCRRNHDRSGAFDLFGDKADQYRAEIGDEVVLSFDIESREYNGRWFTSVRGWKLEKASDVAATPAQAVSADVVNDLPPFPAATDDNDDLPF